MKNFLRSSLIVLALAPALAQAYVTSAVLEFLVDDAVTFYLNGSQVHRRSNNEAFSYQVLSTADGTLPLELFKDEGENLLAAENFNPYGGHMTLCYRLTAYQSDGDPIKVWTDPDNTSMLHLSSRQQNPPGWQLPGFDDSAWGQALAVPMVDQYTMHAVLIEPSLVGIFGRGAVPFITDSPSARSNAGDRNLFRVKFRFPNKAAKVEARLEPAQAAAGQTVTLRLQPGPDLTLASQFNLLAWLPKGLEVTGLSKGGRWDPKLRRVHWDYSNRDMAVGYAQLQAESVVSASGWSNPSKALGAAKPRGKGMERENLPDTVYNDGVIIPAGLPGWFQLSAPPRPAQEEIRIQGVMFHTQLRAGARDMDNKRETDELYFNYSLDGTENGFLKDDVNIMRCSWETYWFDGYYHASEDRDWKWEDLSKIRVMLRGRTVGNADKNLVASIRATVRYYVPGRVAPWVQAKVSDERCAELPITVGAFRQGAKLVSSDPVPLRLNPALCVPTPRPTATEVPVPLVAVRPQPTPTPLGPEISGARYVLGLDCLAVAPEPADYSGCFISFCLKAPARVQVTVYHAETGKALRRFDAGDFRPGANNQVFFNVLDDQQRLLPPGSYLLELVATGNGQKEARNNSFKVVKKRAKR